MNLPAKIAAVSDKPKEEKRKNFFGIFIGTNRTGKSQTAKMYAEKWKRHNPNGKIIAFDPQDSFQDIADEIIYFGQPDLAEVICGARNALIVLDDYKLIHQKYTAERWLTELMNFRAKWNVDIIMVTHSPALVLTYLTYYITHYYIFRTQTQKDSFQKKIPNYELCTKANLYINAYNKLFDGGSWPNFAHIVVTNENDDLLLQNIPQERFLKVLQFLKNQENAPIR
jgi:hypothetical protein